MKRTLAITAAFICAGLIFGTAAFAQRGEKGNRGPGSYEQGSGMEWGGGEVAPPRGDGPGQGFGRRGQGPGGPGGQGEGLKGLFPFWQSDAIVEALVITEDQVAALEQSYQTTKLALEADQGSVKELHEALKTEMEKDAPELETVYGFIDEISAEMTLKKKLLVSHKVVVKTTLTEDQEADLREAIRDDMQDNKDVLRELRREVQKIIRNDGTIEEVTALVAEKAVPAPYDEIAINMATRAIERRDNGEEPAEKGGRRGGGKKGPRRGPDAEQDTTE